MNTQQLTKNDRVQDLLKSLMLRQAKKDGHKPKLPRNNPVYHTPPPSRIRSNLVDHFEKDPAPVSTNELLELIDAQAPNLRRICRDMVKEGLLTSVRTEDGCIYSFVGSAPKAANDD